MNEINNQIEEVQDLVWALVDEQATDEEIRRLEDLLASDEERRIYVMCMQMHSDLRFLLTAQVSNCRPRSRRRSTRRSPQNRGLRCRWSISRRWALMRQLPTASP